jgi:hypothetical protein
MAEQIAESSPAVGLIASQPARDLPPDWGRQMLLARRRALKLELRAIEKLLDIEPKA